MARSRGRGRIGVAAASVVAHGLVLALLSLRVAAPPGRLYEEPVYEVSVMAPFQRPPKTVKARAAAPPSHVRAPPRSAPQAAPTGGPASQPNPAPAPAQLADAGAPGPDLGPALRRRLGCARRDLQGLTSVERRACEEDLGRGARGLASLGQVVSPENRAYYDAVLAARKSEGHGPALACGILFGGGKPAKAKTPPHSLKLGPLPCFIVPPSGMLTPEADVPER